MHLGNDLWKLANEVCSKGNFFGEMIMGTVVQGNFGGVQTQSPQDERVLTEEELLAVDLSFYQSGERSRSLVSDAIARGNELTAYVFDIMEGFELKDESLRLRLGLLKRTRLETLCSLLLQSGEAQWRTQPHYFGAIFVELDGRAQGIVLLASLKSTNDSG